MTASVSRTALLALVVCVASSAARAQSGGAVCDRGYGHFETTFAAGVTVHVGAVPSGGFAARACQAVLSWRDHRVVAVPATAQVDIDVLGADLGPGVPVVAFVVRKAEHDWRASYEIWSLEKKPRLLWTLRGGDGYRAVDADFNRQVAIWTTDAEAVEGFDGLSYSDYPVLPTVVLQFQRGKLVDVSAWYRRQYDRQIAELQSGLTTEALAEFRKSNGRLAFGSVPAAEWVRLRKTKAAVLGIVWAYLYSGRAAEAWAELDAAWPPADKARVKAEILAAQARGIEAQVTRVASRLPPKWAETPFVYEYLRPASEVSKTTAPLNYSSMGLGENVQPESLAEQGTPGEVGADSAPQAISLWRPQSAAAEASLAESGETLRLTIDEAGKVELAKMMASRTDPELMEAVKGWKFIPAMRGGRPVAYEMKIDVAPYR